MTDNDKTWAKIDANRAEERRAAQQRVKAWNNTYPSGTPVVLTRDNGEKFDTKTRSEAWMLSGDSAVVMVDGLAGAYALERVQPRTETNEIDELRAAKAAAYTERDMCVALIARMADALGFRVGLRRHEGEWEDDWRNIVMIDLPPPNGQISWHVHDTEMEWFAWVKPYPGEWDGHSTEEKYRRVLNYFPGYLTDKLKAEREARYDKMYGIELSNSVRRSPAFERGMAKHSSLRQEQHDPVNHPSHYNTGRFEVIDVIEDWRLGFCLGNCVKYIARAGKKDASKLVEDLSKAAWYLDREIKRWNNGGAPDAHDSMVAEFARTVAENRRLQEQVTELQAKMTEMREAARR